MKTMKKVVLALLIGTFISLSFVGCYTNDTEVSDKAGNVSSPSYKDPLDPESNKDPHDPGSEKSVTLIFGDCDYSLRFSKTKEEDMTWDEWLEEYEEKKSAYSHAGYVVLTSISKTEVVEWDGETYYETLYIVL